MDLTQKKLTLSEWNSIEIPVSSTEKSILNLIVAGVYNPNIRENDTMTLINYVKYDKSKEMEYYLFHEYFLKDIQELVSANHAEKKTKKNVGGSSSSSSASSSTKGSSHANANNLTSSSSQQPRPIYVIYEGYKTTLQTWLANIKKIKLVQPNKANVIRLQQTTKLIETNRELLYDFILFDLCKKALQYQNAGIDVYTLIQLKNYNIKTVNVYVVEFIEIVLSFFNCESAQNKKHIFHNAYEYIEKNKLLILYEDKKLYNHQKELFELFSKKEQRCRPCLVLYTAPTGTGKTMSPLGLSEKYKIIFVCVARHVGMSLAKSAISIGKKIGFAFGCETASDIRLHNFSAANFIVNKRSGGIGKVDHSIGTKVEIMICDVLSYTSAMHYMLAFHSSDDIITYWDEPTITMDYENHDLHQIIHRNWSQNKIPKIVLSCATLPKHDEIGNVINNFTQRFTQMENEGETVIVPKVYTIDSFDCKKTITLVNKDCYPVLPHLLFDKYRDVIRSVGHCEENKTLLRYFDVVEIVKFVEFVQENKFMPEEYYVENYFKTFGNITMNSLKLYYLEVLKNVYMENWTVIHSQIKMYTSIKFELVKENSQEIKKIKSMEEKSSSSVSLSASSVAGTTGTMGNHGAPLSRTMSTVHDGMGQQFNSAKGILLTTKDAYTLTDGPTLFLADDVDKIGKFYLQQSQIPEQILNGLLTKISHNINIQEKIKYLEKEVSDKMGGIENVKEKKFDRENMGSKEVQKMVDEIEELRVQLMVVSLNPQYIPNTQAHQEKWLNGYEKVKNAFIPNIGEDDIKDIMGLGVDNNRKLLLILGIGVFGKNGNGETDDGDLVKYTEIMKKLAYNQRLFLIIASTDYIYGTNYQFCHGFLGKDLGNMTQQKIIQAIGRVGRTNIQQEYTIRFRDDELISKLLKPVSENKEAAMMNQLFSYDM
jgi:hypothetical protein